MPERVLVTGAAGFIGSHAVESLLARGFEVAGLDNFDSFYDPAVKRANVAPALRDERFTLHEGDIRDAAAMDALIAAFRPAVIVHMAARAGVRPSISDPALYADVNVVGTTVLLETARRHGVNRLVLAGSSSVYGNAERIPFREDDRTISPLSPYAATKRACELVCDTFASLYPRMRLITLRFFTVYGPRQRPDLAIHKFTRLIAEGEPIPFFGDGSFSRDYTYVTDTMQGVHGAVDRTATMPPGHEVYNLGESATTTLTQLVSLIERAVGREAILDRLPPQAGDVIRTYADISRACAALGYAPSVPIEAGIPRFVDWFRRTHQDAAFAARR
ncbi:MAG: GDP-mannose 4,6-dehydratase [Gemmatimonadota bacterium]|nr:GDP-mannose 4,6-dehydratase [Gemmatimonadota bacterium]